MVLVADIGNTTARVGVWREGAVEQIAVVPTQEIARACAQVERHQASGAGGCGQESLQVAFCSVVPEAERAWVEWTARRGWPTFAVRGDTETPLINRYRDPARLGGDRLAAAVAAVRRFGAPAVVAHLGTVTVVDAVSAGSEFLGGSISVGLRMGLAALSRGTSGLPSARPADGAGPIGADTLDCLRAGAVHGAAALVEGLAERMREAVGRGAGLVLTGGDADLISRHLRLEHEVVPALVLEGVAAVWEHNRGRTDAHR